MPAERLCREWRAREGAATIHPAMSFAPEGLVLGAGTVLVPANADGRLQPLKGREARVLALLAAAYGRPVAQSVLGHIDRAAKCQAHGENSRALIHLALAGLREPADRRAAARRLFMADGLLKAGVKPRTILAALDFDTAVLDALAKFDPDEPRVPAGNGVGSGEWTSDGSPAGSSEPSRSTGLDVSRIGSLAGFARDTSVLADLTPAAARFLAGFARANGVTLALGLLLIPGNNRTHVEGDVPALPGLRYAWNRDEANLLLTYEGQHGTRTIDAKEDLNGQFHAVNDDNKVVAHRLPDDTLVVDPAMVSDVLADRDGPNLCPVATPDKYGRGESEGKGSKDKDYEDQLKLMVNPDNPTPRGYGYKFYDPITGKWVNLDDCQHKTGGKYDFKSEYDHLLDMSWGPEALEDEWLDQSERQIQTAPRTSLTWVFAEQKSAEFAREIFSRDDQDARRSILVLVVPRKGASR